MIRSADSSPSRTPSGSPGTQPVWVRRRGPVKKTTCAGGTPAVQVRLSRFRDTMEQGLVQRQEAQIVQSCITLDDSPP